MKKSLIITNTLLLCCILWGCPYESEVPIADPTEKINPKLLGTWNEEHWEFKISKHNEFTYLYVPRNKYTNELEDTSAFFTTNVNGVLFLNFYEYKSGSSPDIYSLYKLEMKGKKEIRIYPVSDDITEQFTSRDSLKTFIAKNMKKPGFFDGPLFLTRAKK